MKAPESDARIARPGRSTFDPASIAEVLTVFWSDRFSQVPWSVSSLNSDRDQAFGISDGHTSYLLKVANSMAPDGTVELEAACIAALAESGLPNQDLVAADDGRRAVVLEDDSGAHQSRLLRWLPGDLYSEHRPHDRILHERLGVALAEMDLALGSVDPQLGERAFDWDLVQCRAVLDRHREEIDEDDRQLIAPIRQRLDEIDSTLGSLRRQVIHNDANDNNILVELDSSGDPMISGIIDFGDAVTSALVCEVAVAMTYAMLDVPDPLAASAGVLKGYCSRLPLTAVEVSMLFDLVRARLALSVTMSAYQKSLEPDNEYVVISEAPAWRLLSRLAAVSPEYAEICFRSAAGLAPVRSADAVTTWLASRRESMADVLRPELLAQGVTLVDLSAESELFSPGDNQQQVVERVERLLASSDGGSRVGLGRHGEARLLYLGDQFDDEDGARTVHLGIDLFAPAGEPVFAPLDGEVVSFVDNDLDYDYGPTLILRHRCEGITRSTDEAVEFFTLWGHLSRASLPGLEPGQKVMAGQKLAELGDFEENGGWPPHLHLQLITCLFDDSGNFPGVAQKDKAEVWTSISPSPKDLLGKRLVEEIEQGELEVSLPPDRVEQLLQRRRRHLGPNLSLSFQTPLEIVRGRGAYLFDSGASCYLDLVNNVCHVGHCHPHVVEAGQRQMALLNTNTRYLHEIRLAYAEQLLATLPEPLSVLYLVNSGSEANDLALRLARAATGRSGVVTLDGAYHGNLGALVDVSPYKHDGPGGRGTPPHVAKVLMPDPYRGEFRQLEPERAAAEYAAAVAAGARGLAEAPGVFIAEPILSCGGQIVPPPGYFAQSYRAMRELGALCVSDEVQVGFGRVGECFWGFELHGVVPDIVTMGKPIGNGHPIGAVVTTREIADAFDNGMEYFNTYGGNPVSCAIGKAVLEVIEQEELQQRALEVGGALRSGLEELADHYDLIGDVRGHGLFLGFELVDDRDTLQPAAARASRLVERMRHWGFLLSTDGPLHNVIKIKPPLQISEGDAYQTLQALDEVLSESALQPGAGMGR